MKIFRRDQLKFNTRLDAIAEFKPADRRIEVMGVRREQRFHAGSVESAHARGNVM